MQCDLAKQLPGKQRKTTAEEINHSVSWCLTAFRDATGRLYVIQHCDQLLFQTFKFYKEKAKHFQIFLLHPLKTTGKLI